MLIDPFVVVAQLVNFALLVWLLRRFLYGPITRAMAAREARIRAETEDARRLRSEAAAEGDQYRALLTEFEAEREARLASVHSEVDELRKSRLSEARAEVQAQRERWQHTLAQEKEAFLRELRLRVGQESLAAMRRAFAELADEELEERLVNRFVERMREMDPVDREQLIAAARDDGNGFLVTTAFPPSEAQRDQLGREIAALFSTDFPVSFETDPQCVAGVEVRAGGLKVAWTIDDYLHSLEDAIRDLFPDAATLPEADVVG